MNGLRLRGESHSILQLIAFRICSVFHQLPHESVHGSAVLLERSWKQSHANPEKSRAMRK